MTDDEIVKNFHIGKADNVGELISKLQDINSPKLPVVLNIYYGNNEVESFSGDIEFMVDIDTNGKPTLFLLAESRQPFKEPA